jgi:cystathionine beta-lyase/cystathionine gamma-synthase
MTEQRQTGTQGHSEAVEGEFAISATLPTLRDVIGFKEGTVEFAQGYYRFLPHPRLRELEKTLKDLFHCRHCRLGESLESVLHELLDLEGPRPGGRLWIFRDPDSRGWTPDSMLFEGMESRELSQPVPPDFTADDVVLLAGKDPAGLLERAGDVVSRAQESGARMVVVLPDLPLQVPETPTVRFWVTELSTDGSQVRAGAVLSSLDRPMNRLGEWMKRHGAILSSRNAARLLGCEAIPFEESSAESVASWLCGRENGARAFLSASGMSAVTSVLDIVRRSGKSRIVSIGHLYGDTFDSLRFAPRGPGEEENLFLGVDEMDKLEGAITAQTAAILTESIMNPLNDVPDIPRIAEAARRFGVPLIVDNTIATPRNCMPLDLGADVVVHSTTKFLNGKNNHGGGAVIVRDPGISRQLERRQKMLKNGMSPLEAEELWKNLRTFDERMERFNANGLAVAGFLAGHPAVKRLYFNGHPSHRCHETAAKLLKGASSVISFTLVEDSMDGLRAFYDSPMPGIIKAPSLGSDRTLLCPYVLLAHYNDPEEVLESFGASRWLVRISVGCEPDIGPVIDSLDGALRKPLSRGSGAQ